MVETITIKPRSEGMPFVKETEFDNCTVEEYYSEFLSDSHSIVVCEVSGDASEFRDKVRMSKKVDIR